jgi:hypothetical protein
VYEPRTWTNVGTIFPSGAHYARTLKSKNSIRKRTFKNKRPRSWCVEMSDLSNDAKKHTTKSRETIPLRSLLPWPNVLLKYDNFLSLFWHIGKCTLLFLYFNYFNWKAMLKLLISEAGNVQFLFTSSFMLTTENLQYYHMGHHTISKIVPEQNFYCLICLKVNKNDNVRSVIVKTCTVHVLNYGLFEKSPLLSYVTIRQQKDSYYFASIFKNICNQHKSSLLRHD